MVRTPKFKMFDGKRYEQSGRKDMNKKQAVEYARIRRQLGYNVRVVGFKERNARWWAIFQRKK